MQNGRWAKMNGNYHYEVRAIKKYDNKDENQIIEKYKKVEKPQIFPTWFCWTRELIKS